jgi:hypothetical protein
VEYLHLFRAFLGFRFQAFLLSDSEESSDSSDEDDEGYGDGYDMHDMVFCVCTLSGSLLKVFLDLQCKITEKMVKDQFLRCHLLHIVLIEATYPNFIWRVLNYLVFLWRITTL